MYFLFCFAPLSPILNFHFDFFSQFVINKCNTNAHCKFLKITIKKQNNPIIQKKKKNAPMYNSNINDNDYFNKK